jgi:hypothetical protein
MIYTRPAKFIGVVVALLLLNSIAHADNCNDILWHGIYDELNYKSAEEFQKDFRFVLNMSREEREKYLKEQQGSLSIGLKTILTLGLAGGDTEEAFHEIKESLAIDQRLVWNSKSFQKLQIKLVNPKIVEAWKACKLKHGGGIQVEIIGDKNDETGNFIVQVNWMPNNKELAIKSVKVTQVTVTGATPKGAITLKDGSEIQPFSGLSQIFAREAKKEVNIVINFDGHPSARESLAKIEPPPVIPKPKPTIVTHVRIEYWVSHDDKDWNPEEVITHEVQANGKVVLGRDTPSQSGQKPPFGANERWDHRGIQGPYPARRKQGGVPADRKTEGERKFDFGHKEDRTFPLDDNVHIELGQGMKGRLDIRKGGTDRWEDFSVRLYGITNKGFEIRYDRDWKSSLQGRKNDAGWDFEWDKGQK